MPVIIVGADTPIGTEIVAKLVESAGEVRTFITDPAFADAFTAQHCKVAIGDVSDPSHIEIAGFEAFTAVLITEAALDSRERAFSTSPESTAAAWIGAVTDARIQRVIWIGTHPLHEPPGGGRIPELAVLNSSDPDIAVEVGRLNELAELP